MRQLQYTALAALLLLCLTCKQEETAPSTTTATTTAAVTPVQVITYVAPDPSVFQSSDTINGWINSNPINTAAIADHAWDLWAAITAPSGQTLNGTPLPVWETWYDTTEVYRLDLPDTGDVSPIAKKIASSKTANPKRRLHPPVQSLHHGSLGNVKARKTAASLPDIPPGVLGAALVTTFNRFTQEMYDHVGQNNYWQKSTLTSLNGSFSPNTNIADRVIQPFPNTSIMMKPVFIIISGTQPTMLPYWNGISDSTTTNQQNPNWFTWKQCVLVDPTGTAKNDQDRWCNQSPQPGICGDGGTDPPCGNTLMKAGTYQVVPVSANPSNSAFYAFQLTQAEVDDLALYKDEFFVAGGIQTPQIQAGDYAIFVATHMSSREINNWTWQTFWWQPNPSQLPSEPPNALTPPASIPKPWNQYAACTAYYMVTPATDPQGTPLRCYNPYLETDLVRLLNEPQTSTSTGVNSNCMSCHRASSFPQASANDTYASVFLLDPSDPIWFANNVKLDFAWSMNDFSH
jgi:hypothetical protein